MGSTGLSRVLRAGLERLAERRADAPESCEATAAVFARVPASARVRGGPRWRVKRAAGEDALLAAAGAALLDPALAVVAGGCLRPVATHALTHALDAALAAAAAEEDSAADDEARARDAARRRASAGASSARSPAKSSHDAGPAGAVHSAGSEGRPTAHERICAALGSLVELLPHVAPIAARYLRACEGARPDVTHLSLQLLPYPWFARQHPLHPRMKRWPDVAAASTDPATERYERLVEDVATGNLDAFPAGIYLDLHGVHEPHIGRLGSWRGRWNLVPWGLHYRIVAAEAVQGDAGEWLARSLAEIDRLKAAYEGGPPSPDRFRVGSWEIAAGAAYNDAHSCVGCNPTRGALS